MRDKTPLNKLIATIWAFCALLLGACSGGFAGSKSKIEYQHYRPVVRQLPPEPVYSRLTWSHPPKPIPHEPEEVEPVYLPFSAQYEFKSATLEEALNGAAQSIGYEARYTKLIASRPVSIELEGTLEEFLKELCKQTGTVARISTYERWIELVDDAVAPGLPEAQRESSGT